jgi:uncharacterized YccA/Bax inhibitor family protein
MQSKNPFLTRMEQEAKSNGGYAGFGAAPTATVASPDTTLPAPTYTPTTEAPAVPMTVADVVAKTAAMFVPLLITAYAAWALEISYGVVLVAMFVALGLGIWGAVSSKVRPVVYLAYAAVEGVVVGGFSFWIQQWVNQQNPDQPNIVAQAVIGTFAAFIAMLFLYTTRILKVTSTFKRFMMIALYAYLGIAIVSLIAALFGVGQGFGFYGIDGIGLLLCAAGVALAAFTLALDFDAIETMVKVGAPERESWRAAFGLVVTLVWLYLELLRLLALLNRN